MSFRFARFCISAISFGVTPHTSFEERKKMQILNVVLIAMIVGGGIRTVSNLYAHLWQPLPFNLFFMLGGCLSMGFILKKRFRTAAAVGLLTAALSFAATGWLFHNGREESLLLLIAIGSILFGSTALRYLFFAILGGLFIAVKISYRDLGDESHFLFVVNMVVFLFAYCWLLNIFHEIYNTYREEIDRKNASLQEANQAKNKIFSLISHDFLGPIGRLKSSLDFLDQDLISPADFKAYRQTLQQEVGHVIHSMRNTLNWSTEQLQRIEAIPETISLRAVADEALQLLSGIGKDKGVCFENRIPEDAQAWADRTQVVAIFRNLLSNAVKFTPSGGLVEIDGKKRTPTSGEWEISVRDTGVGMKPEQLEKLFAPGNYRSTPGTNRESGIGLGLRICHEFVGKNGGTITTESAPGSGTSIRFTLPAASA
ncbi:Signal transduction histidine kinase [Verrucomicrobium sp. GAS474]|uniref:sensor histidine kinase n=1 Tax=Verrucomicrobium sp. GAS474 TaxID=1882831 RepID=UPI000879E92C|nr:HAMP domain-containing sensor histidine kinase [Verrucomicrobium sp. GAS474]SDU22651.1 Signal transduction histidine kinase [Verrucomicrobium sp. GAS474]